MQCKASQTLRDCHTNPRLAPSPLPPLSKVRCCRPKKFGRLPEGLLAPLRFAPHSYRPLSKVRCCRRKNSGGYRRDCHTNLALHPTLPNPYYPSKITNTLASLVKGRWIDGKAQTVALLRLNCDTPALFITKPFCRQDGGIAAPTFAPHYPTRFSCCEFDSPTSPKK